MGLSQDRTRYTASQRAGSSVCGRLPSPSTWFQEPFEKGEETSSYSSGGRSKKERTEDPKGLGRRPEPMLTHVRMSLSLSVSD